MPRSPLKSSPLSPSKSKRAPRPKSPRKSPSKGQASNCSGAGTQSKTLTKKSRKRKRRSARLQAQSGAKPCKKKKLSETKYDAEEEDNQFTSSESEEEDDCVATALDLKRLEEQLEKTAATSNLTVTNVKSILHHVLSDKRLLSLAQSAAEEKEGKRQWVPEDLDQFEPKMTRSRSKPEERAVTSGSTFLDADFEDSDDEEYSPENDKEVLPSDEESYLSSLSDVPTPQTPVTPEKSTIDVDTLNLESLRSDDTGLEFPSVVSHESEPVFKVPGTPPSARKLKVAQSEDELIAKRTRSKLPMRDLSLEWLEASFQAPDFDPDIYDLQEPEELDIDDLEWKNWLSKLMKDDVALEESFEENDEDFNYMADAEIDDHEIIKEEFRNDKAVKITQKELQDLFDELLDGYEGANDDGSSSDANQTLPTFNEQQQLRLTAQFQQHTQLLTQVYLLSYGDPTLQDEALFCRQLLKELQNFDKRAKELLSSNPEPRLSFYSFDGLEDAVRIIDEADISDGSGRALRSTIKSPTKFNIPKGRRRVSDPILPVPKSIALTLAEENYFATYPELIPFQGMVHNIPEIVRSKDSLRLKFFQSEDNLLAMGLAQFHRNYRLIAEHMLPAKTPKQLKIRSKNLNSKREPSNPVKCLKRTGALQLVETRVAVHEPREISPIPLYHVSKKQWYEVRMPEWFLKLQDLLLKQESGVKPAEIEMEYDDNMIAFMTRNNLRHIAKKENDETQEARSPSIPDSPLYNIASTHTSPRIVSPKAPSPSVPSPAVSSVPASPCVPSPANNEVATEEASVSNRDSVNNETDTQDFDAVEKDSKRAVEAESKDTVEEEGDVKETEVGEPEEPDVDSNQSKSMDQQKKLDSSASKQPPKKIASRPSKKPTAKKSEFNWEDKIKEKQIKFADLYFKKVKETLSGNPELYVNFLNTISASGKQGISRVELYWKLSDVLKDHQELLDDFVGFLDSGEAKEVGKFMTWFEFDKATQFLLNCEAHLYKNPAAYQKFIKTLISLHKAEKNSKKFVDAIAPLLKGNQKLLTDFTTFFPDLPPPPSKDEDFEVIVYRIETGGFGHVDEFEEVSLLPDNNEDDALGKRNRLPLKTVKGHEKAKLVQAKLNYPSFIERRKMYKRANSAQQTSKLATSSLKLTAELDKEQRSRRNSTSPTVTITADSTACKEENMMSPSASIKESENVVSSIELTCNEELSSDFYDGQSSDKEQAPATKTNRTCKNLFPGTESDPDVLEAIPDGELGEGLCDFEQDKDSTPNTKQGKLEKKSIPANNLHVSEEGARVVKWKREEDRIILCTCQLKGSSNDVFEEVAKKIGDKTSDEVRQRFHRLMELYETARKDSPMKRTKNQMDDNDEKETESSMHNSSER